MNRDFNMESIDLHKQIRGKINLNSKVRIDIDKLPLLYTPGISGPCLDIHENPESVFELTWKWNSVAVISDGSRLLGLGNRGPLASLPLLEGKSILFSYYGGVDAVPLPVSSLPARQTVDIIKAVSHGFGAINLEDISTPRCFEILETLRAELDIPVFHDDQQGTAVIIVAGLINALKLTGKEMRNAKIVLLGLGAANTAIYRLLRFAGVDASQFRVFNSEGIIGSHRKDMMDVEVLRDICMETNPAGKFSSIEEAMTGADAIIALSTPGPGVIKPEWINSMNRSPIVFACANPIPEIDPVLAKSAGAAIVATGRSDYPNQLNNALVFPGIFRGALDVRAKTITWGMCLAVSYAIAGMAENKGLGPDYIVPSIEEKELSFNVAMAAVSAAIEEGVARINRGNAEIFKSMLRNNLNKEKRSEVI